MVVAESQTNIIYIMSYSERDIKSFLNRDALEHFLILLFGFPEYHVATITYISSVKLYGIEVSLILKH